MESDKNFKGYDIESLKKRSKQIYDYYDKNKKYCEDIHVKIKELFIKHYTNKRGYLENTLLDGMKNSFIMDDIVFYIRKYENRRVFLDNIQKKYKKRDTIIYLWIGLTEENYPVLIGKSRSQNPSNYNGQFSVDCGDLFAKKRYKENKDDAVEITGKILSYIINGTDMLKKEEAEINRFIKKAIVIPLDLNYHSDAKALESRLGEFLINNNIPLIDDTAHLR